MEEGRGEVGGQRRGRGGGHEKKETRVGKLIQMQNK